MKTFNLYLALAIMGTVLLGTSCKSIEKSVYNGDYTYAINKLEKKLEKANHKKRDEYILLLENAYARAMKEDINTLQRLSANPYNWKKVVNKYEYLMARQNKLERYLPLFIKKENRNANFKTYDYTNELIAYKSDAAGKLYAIVQNKLKSNSKTAIRQANDLLRDVSLLNPNYKDVSKLIYDTNKMGKNYVFINIENRSGAFLPAQLNNELTNFTVQDLNQKWLTYHNSKKANVNYDYDVNLVLHEIFVLPPVTDKKVIEQKQKVKDGWEYVLDKRGNVKKDSLGNDMKKDKFKWVRAKVGENLQRKQATIAGVIYIIDNRSGQLVKEYPVSGNAVFENMFYDFIGDERALTKEFKIKIKQTRPAPFPNEFQMLNDANNLFENAVKESLDSNSRFVIN